MCGPILKVMRDNDILNNYSSVQLRFYVHSLTRNNAYGTKTTSVIILLTQTIS